MLRRGCLVLPLFSLFSFVDGERELFLSFSLSLCVHSFTVCLEDDLSLGSHLLVEGLSLSLHAGSHSVLVDLLASSSDTSSLLLLSSLLLGEEVGVESHSHAQVLEGVLLPGHSVHSEDGGTELGLDFVGVDESSQVRVRHDGSGEGVPVLALVREEGLQSLEGALGPDDQSAEVSTGSHLQEGQVVHVHRLHAGEVSDGQVDALGVVVHHDGADSSSPSSVSPLAVAGSQLLGLLASHELVLEAEGLEEGVGVSGLGDGGGLVGDDEGDLLDVIDSVASGSHDRRDGGSSDGGSQGEPLLVQVDLPVPLSPGLGGLEHSAASAHVAESTLTGSLRTGSSHSSDSGHGSTGTPGLGGGLLAGLSGDGVGLSGVLGHVGVHEVDDVGTDGRLEDIGQRHLRVGGLAVQTPNGDELTSSSGSRHCE